MMKNLSHFASLLTLVFAFQVGMSSSLFAKKGEGKNAYEKRISGKGKGMNKFGLIGFRFGLNIASLSTNEQEKDLIKDTGVGFGVSAGLTLDRAIPGNDYIGIRVEGLFQQKSFNHTSPAGYDNMGKSVDSSTTLNFLEVPVLITLRFSKGKIRPIAYFGGYGAALIAASGQQNNVTNADARLPFKTFDFGMVLGGGANFYLGKGAGLISTELRYSRGFANLADGNILEGTLKEHGFGTDDPLKNSIYNTNNFSLLVTYHF
jgi:hypothetical protein